MRTSARHVAVVLFDEVELLDVAGPIQVLSVAGRHWNWRPFKISSVSAETGLVNTRNQLRIEASSLLDTCPNPELLLVPGGYGARRALNDPILIDWLTEKGAKAEFVAAIGYGVLLLAKAGLIRDRRAAVPSEVAEVFAELVPEAQADEREALVIDGNLLTVSASASGLDLALELIVRTLGKKQATTVANKLGHRWTSHDDTLRIVSDE